MEHAPLSCAPHFVIVQSPRASSHITLERDRTCSLILRNRLVPLLEEPDTCRDIQTSPTSYLQHPLKHLATEQPSHHHLQDRQPMTHNNPTPPYNLTTLPPSHTSRSTRTESHLQRPPTPTPSTTTGAPTHTITPLKTPSINSTTIQTCFDLFLT